jgi:hypothetical protein
VALTTVAQRLYDMARDRPRDFEAAQRAFNDQQMMPQQRMQPQPTMQQQQQIQPKKEE